MNAITREEFDAKLESIDIRMDLRVARIEGKIDAFLARTESNEKMLLLLSEKAASSADRASGLQATLWITSITTVLSVFAIAIAAYFANQQSNIGIVQSTIAASESGKAQSAQAQQPVPPATFPAK